MQNGTGRSWSEPKTSGCYLGTKIHISTPTWQKINVIRTTYCDNNSRRCANWIPKTAMKLIERRSYSVDLKGRHQTQPQTFDTKAPAFPIKLLNLMFWSELGAMKILFYTDSQLHINYDILNFAETKHIRQFHIHGFNAFDSTATILSKWGIAIFTNINLDCFTRHHRKPLEFSKIRCTQ